MKKLIYILIFILPFIFVVLVNEYSRWTSIKKYQISGIEVMNSQEFDQEKCSWSCHNNTMKCKQFHSHGSEKYFTYTDPLYFGFITLLQQTGDYKLANVLLFIIFIPLWIYFFLIKIISTWLKIKKLN